VESSPLSPDDDSRMSDVVNNAVLDVPVPPARALAQVSRPTTPAPVPVVIKSPPAKEVAVHPGKPSTAPVGFRKPRMLHLFSGPTTRQEGISNILRKIGWECLDVDVVNVALGLPKEQQDLSSDHLWASLTSEVSNGAFDFVWMGTPCTTFSRARQGPPGPPPLRSLEHIYGFPKPSLSQADWDDVQLGNYFAIQSARMATLALNRGVGFGIENPAPWPGFPSIFLLPEFQTLASAAGVSSVDFDQCPFGSETAKPTRVLYAFVDFSTLQGKCNHPKQWWSFTDWWGQPQRHFGAHPPLFNRRRDSGEPATKAAAAYPYALNKAIVRAVIARGRSSPAAPPPASS